MGVYLLERDGCIFRKKCGLIHVGVELEGGGDNWVMGVGLVRAVRPNDL